MNSDVPRVPQSAEGHIIDFLGRLRERVVTGVVGGSDLAKAKEQLGDDCAWRVRGLPKESVR